MTLLRAVLLPTAMGACAEAGVAGLPKDAGAPPYALDAEADAALGAEQEGVVDSGSQGVVTDGGGGAEGCELGAAGSFATDQSLDLFGDIIYFAKGHALPKGRYRAAYEDGCMKYNNIFLWTVNGSATDGWWLVGESASERVALLPGTSPQLIIDGHADFAACVSANQALPPVEFDFDGGKLGIWLNDSPYQDNQAGEGGRNPKWSLTLLEQKCPPELEIF